MRGKILTALVYAAFFCALKTVCAQGTAFTYQGRLNSGSSPANGLYDLSFTLFATNSGGNPSTQTLTNSAISVTNGLFTTILDFGNNFSGNPTWLEIAVATNGGSFTTLSPRQPLTPTPYAMFANTASNLLGAVSNLTVNGNIFLNSSNGTSYVASGSERLRVVRGTVNGPNSGAGFSVYQDSNTQIYMITFNPAFSDYPSVAGSAADDIVSCNVMSSSQVAITVYSPALHTVSARFNFIAVGPQ